MDNTFTLDQLCVLTDLPKRTIRYYMQLGIVDRPNGETRAAHYLPKHLEQLVEIKRLTTAGVSLERVREVLAGNPSPVPPSTLRAGSIQVRTHVFISDGVELQIDPEKANLSPEQLRSFVKSVLTQWNEINNG
jgi:DNA-binding transcriptional MerR regulator